MLVQDRGLEIKMKCSNIVEDVSVLLTEWK
jgi:hypothetical protein